MQTAKTASLLAAITAVVFFLLLAFVHLHGISQQYFEMVHSPEKYTEEITEHHAALNIIFVADNIFIICYTAMAFFTIQVLRNKAASFVSMAACIAIAAVGFLDFLENFHIYVMMQQARSGVAVTTHDIQWQSTESMLKWHLAYFTFFMLAFLLPADNLESKLLKYSVWFWFVPTGVLVYATVDSSYAGLFQWIRFFNLLSGFVLIFFIMRKISRAS